MSGLVLVAWIGGVLVGGAFGALLMALCVAVGRGEEPLVEVPDGASARRHEA